MDNLFLSAIIFVVWTAATVLLTFKYKNVNNKSNLFSLILIIIVAVNAHAKITNPDIKILYSLCLIIMSGIGRYATIIMSKTEKDKETIKYNGYRHILYAILFLYGLLGLII